MHHLMFNRPLINRLFLLLAIFALLALLVPVPYIAAYDGGESQNAPANPYGDRPNIGSNNAPRQTLAAAAFYSHDCSLNTGNPFTNCSFENGDFAGWITQDLADPLTALDVVGAGYGLWFFTSSPTQGSWVAINGFDGGGPGVIQIAQDVSLSQDAGYLIFDYRAAWDMIPYGATLDRHFYIDIEPEGGGTELQRTNLLTAEAGTTDDTGDLNGVIDVRTYAGTNVRISFEWEVPEYYTGPASFQLDNVEVILFNADFSASPTSGIAPFETTFTNTSAGAFSTCSWDFGDLGTSTDCGPVNHTYASAGTYSVSLTIEGMFGTDTLTRSNYITVYEPVSAAFTAIPTTGPFPLDVQFTNGSTGDFDTCAWDFGDGDTSTDCNDPSHTYANFGEYTVTLQVSGLGGTSEVTETQYISVEEVEYFLPIVSK